MSHSITSFFSAVGKDSATSAQAQISSTTSAQDLESSTTSEIAPGCFLRCIPLPKHLHMTGAKYDELFAAQPEERGKVMIMGRLVDVPRKQEPFFQPYYYSGVQHEPKREPLPIFVALKDFISSLQLTYTDGSVFTPNGALTNWYKNGHDYIGAHADDEGSLKQVDRGSFVACVSYGCSRKLRLREKNGRAIVKDVDIAPNSVYIMCGKFQKELLHEFPKVGGKKGETIGSRISVTFREFSPASAGEKRKRE